MVGKEKEKEKEKTLKRTPISFSEMAKKPGNPQPIVKRRRRNGRYVNEVHGPGNNIFVIVSIKKDDVSNM